MMVFIRKAGHGQGRPQDVRTGRVRVRGWRWDDGGVAPPEVLGRAHLRMPVPGSTRYCSTRGSAVNSSRALGSAEFFQPRYHAGIATREDKILGK
jgi:hypothetical protein